MEVKRANNCPFRQLAQISGPQHSEPPRKALALGRPCGSNGSCVPYGFFLSHQCWLTCRSTGPIAAGRHLGYKSLAQIPAHRNRPVSFDVIRLQFRTDCDGTDMAPHRPAAAISRNVLVSCSSNVFSFATTQRMSCFACGPSVLRRPAHLRAVSTTVIQHHENPASSRCASAKLLASCAVSAIAVSASGVTFQAPQGIQSRPPFLYSALQLRASCFRHQMQKSGQAHLCGAQQPAQQPSLAARQPQCTHNLALNRTFCGGPRLGYKILAQTQPAAKCRLALR